MAVLFEKLNKFKSQQVLFASMIDTINALTKERKKIDAKDIITLEKKTSNYILSLPHSGELILAEFEKNINICKELLIGSDLYTDQVYNTGKGIVIKTLLNNYQLNMSRPKNASNNTSLPNHLKRDPLHGFTLTGQPIVKKEYTPEETKKLMAYYDKYHNCIKQAITKMKQTKEYALLFDCHSLNSKGLADTPDAGQERADFIIGTLDDKSAHQELINTFYDALKSEAVLHNMTVKKNYPYKGGYITQKYACPDENIHAIQLEIKKSNYMNESINKGNFEIDKKGMQKINRIIQKAFDATAQKASVLF